MSVASQFRTSLQLLVSDLEKTSPHFIRCVKPNSKKKANTLDSGEVLRQLRYAGMMETIRIRRQGYSVREEHESFYSRFSLVLNSKDRDEGIEFLVKDLSQRLNVTDADWQIGHTKIFLRRELADKLADLAQLHVKSAARTITKFGRAIARARAAGMITVWSSYRVHCLRVHYRRIASTAIVAALRTSRQRKKYQSALRAVVMLQSLCRNILAREYLRKLRDPYGDLSFEELERLQASRQETLDEAVLSKEFKRAAEIEMSMCVESVTGSNNTIVCRRFSNC